MPDKVFLVTVKTGARGAQDLDESLKEMKELAESKKKAIAGEGESNEPKRPKGVPDNAKWDAKTRTWNK